MLSLPGSRKGGRTISIEFRGATSFSPSLKIFFERCKWPHWPLPERDAPTSRMAIALDAAKESPATHLCFSQKKHDRGFTHARRDAGASRSVPEAPANWLKVLPVDCRRIPSRRLRTFGVWVSSPARETGRGFFSLGTASEQSLSFQPNGFPSESDSPASKTKNHSAMKYLTKEQQIVLCVILLLLLTGLGVKTWRTARPTQALPSKQPNQAGK